MFTDDGKKTIFDGIQPKKINSDRIPEDNIIKPTQTFSINKDKFNTSLIVDDYKIPSFKFSHDNSLNDFYDFPDISVSQNPIYKYKYPKLSTAETIKEQWQTEEGTPNELNRFLRQELTGKSIDDIKNEDYSYEDGLKQIQQMINEDTEKIRNKLININKDKSLTKFQRIKETIEVAKENDINKNINKNKLRQYKAKNPVIIKPAITPPTTTPPTIDPNVAIFQQNLKRPKQPPITQPPIPQPPIPQLQSAPPQAQPKI